MITAIILIALFVVPFLFAILNSKEAKKGNPKKNMLQLCGVIAALLALWTFAYVGEKLVSKYTQPHIDGITSLLREEYGVSDPICVKFNNGYVLELKDKERTEKKSCTFYVTTNLGNKEKWTFAWGMNDSGDYFIQNIETSSQVGALPPYTN